MKLISCSKCNDLMMLVNDYTRTCFCGYVGGKYLNDNITAVVNEDAVVVGIDNNGLSIAKQMAEHNKDYPHRIDYFFTGWIPTKPGEVIVVETVEDVLAYDYNLPDEERTYDSTPPTESCEQEEKYKYIAICTHCGNEWPSNETHNECCQCGKRTNTIRHGLSTKMKPNKMKPNKLRLTFLWWIPSLIRRFRTK